MTEDADRLDAESGDGDEFVFVDEATAADDPTATDDPETARTDSSGKPPLADLAAAVRDREDRPRSEDDLFESVEVDSIDADAVWADLEGPDSSAASPESPLSDRGAADVSGEESVVPKRSYCERCRYFTDPPEVACTHDGTEIVELVDADHFRVRDCPMVGGDDDRDVAEFE